MITSGRVGELTYHRIVEIEQPEFDVHFFLPDATPDRLAPYREWLEPRFLDPATNKLVLAIQSYVLRTPHHIILIDTCVGNDKTRGFVEDWNMRSSMTYLEELARVGLAPEDIDFVMCTHLHMDHVGWNTRLIDGRWTPTFPNARYVFARTELEFWTERYAKNPEAGFGAIADSVAPVLEAGLADMVDDDFALGDHIRLEPTPGHTPGHVAVHLESRGHRAVLSGDVMHTPLHCREPGWSAVGCMDKALSARTRRAFLERHCDTDTLVMTAHFPSPSVGHVRAHGDAFDFSFIGE